MMTRILLSLMVLAAFAGCTDDAAPEPEPTTTTTTTTTGAPSTGPPVEDEEDVPEPIVLTGTVTGIIDCSLAGQGQAPNQATSISIPAEAAGRDYSFEVGASGLPQDPGTTVLCHSFDGATWMTGSSGVVPDDASSVQVAGDTAYEHAFTITVS